MTIWRIRRHIFWAGLLSYAVISSLGCSRGLEPTISIGVIVTTKNEMVKDSALKAVRMVRLELEESDGLMVAGKKYPVRFPIEYIDGGVPEQAVSAASRLINQENIVALIGPDFSIDAIPSAEITEKKGIPLVSPRATSPVVTTGRKYAFQVSFTDDIQARAAADFCVQELKGERIAVLFNKTNPYSKGLAETFREAVLNDGGKLTSYESYVAASDGFTKQLGRIKKADSRILYLPNFSHENILILKEIGALEISATLFGTDSWDRERLGNLPQLEGSYMTRLWDPGVTGEKTRAFISKYTSLYGTVPQDGAALTYDAIMLVIRAIQLEEQFDPQSVRDGLYALDVFEGVTGKIDYVDSGKPLRAGLILKLEGDRATVTGRFSSR